MDTVYLHTQTYYSDDDEKNVTVENFPNIDKMQNKDSMSLLTNVIKLNFSGFRKYDNVILNFIDIDVNNIKIIICGKYPSQKCIIEGYHVEQGLLYIDFDEVTLFDSSVDCIRFSPKLPNEDIHLNLKQSVVHNIYGKISNYTTDIRSRIYNTLIPDTMLKLNLGDDLYYSNGRYFDFSKHPHDTETLNQSVIENILPYMV